MLAHCHFAARLLFIITFAVDPKLPLSKFDFWSLHMPCKRFALSIYLCVLTTIAHAQTSSQRQTTNSKKSSVDVTMQSAKFRSEQIAPENCVLNEAVGEGTGHPPYRPQGDYITFVYDASTGNAYWHDFTRLTSLQVLPPDPNDKAIFSISRTATFAPVLLTRQKANMLFCNMHFGDTYSVQTVTNNVVEATADIRNGPASAASTTAPTPTLDSTTAANLSATAASQPSLQMSPSLINVSSQSPFNALKGDGKTYEQRTLVVSASQVAQLVSAYMKGTTALGNQLDNFREVNNIQSEASGVTVEIATFKGNASFHFYSNQPLFIEESGKAQRVVSDLNRLSSDLTTEAFLSRAVTLASNFAYLETILSTVSDRMRYDGGCPVTASTIGKDVFGDIEGCAPHEAQTLQAFLTSIDSFLQYYEPGAPTVRTFLQSKPPSGIVSKIATLRQALDNAQTSAQELFNAMNDWYLGSSVQDIKTLPSLQTNASIQISLAVRRNFVPFQFGSTTASGTTTATTSASLFQPIINSLLVEVHRKVYFNVVGGALAFHIPSTTYAFQPCKDGNGNAGFCPYQTAKSNFQVQGLAAVVWNPWGRDYFPFGSSQSVGLYGWHRLVPGLMLGTSVTSLGNAFAGVNVEPTNGIDLYVGAANGTSTKLGPGVTTGTFFSDDKYLPTVTTQRVGFAFGVGLDYTVFCSIFKKGCGS
jgi:hypothetical protein